MNIVFLWTDKNEIYIKLFSLPYSHYLKNKLQINSTE